MVKVTMIVDDIGLDNINKESCEVIEEIKNEEPCHCKQDPHRKIALVKPFLLICGVSPNSLRLMDLDFLKVGVVFLHHLLSQPTKQ